ncbi:methyl-accepting chemotaxis protein [Paenibacillus thiaminolyticus]|uniref:Methyl-accepting chemotaxis protein n=1 Tax=Paenibacillus thiaminolyticus TaxID=49283 RepID=A0AAP9DY54_PANTH|nr:methyl-accepting chemotaxis protein [Paenibacillus thiaminolyticus]MCY9538690.1 methyl-accepting chemotaxis protein [Paenibacillus thiaminolyticus]MCY9604419.1 methyl-accepting chemotaxis protein [Paenibacillus thiaminolyticus]MCY9605583.1 methyl-accepting chemotaxis protein [Paenibacillus thiaminolyticus]MCY9616210.1 methyl-accepting chemotaxis protein [Paenibacillus thiaminolyticus]MCY9619287.1 methyl-accepting chemotaxis protein [Paenibacillus thiaminolyticus]
MRNKSLVFKSVLVLSVLITVMSVVFTSFSYMSERGIYYDELLNVHTSLDQQISLEIEGIAKAEAKMKTMSYDQYMEDQEMDWIQTNLQAMTREGYISNSYLIKPDLIEKDGKVYMSVIQANDNMIEHGSKPLSDVEMTEAFRQAYYDMKKDGIGISAVYADSMGEWLTVLSPIQDDQDNTIALLGIDFNYSKINHDLNQLMWRNIAVGAVTGIAFILLIMWLIRKTIRPLHELAELAKRAAKGDLTVRIPVNSRDEIGVLSSSFNEMITDIRELIGSMKETTSHVTEASNHLTVISQQTAQSTHEISSAIQEVASGSETQLTGTEESKIAMGEMAVGIQRIAESSSNVSEYSVAAAQAAKQGNEVVQQTVAQMNSIHSSVNESVTMVRKLAQQSNEIEQIVAVIGNIATQTNLLALNASIEAARAGEHGRGFGVVAKEVRSLAEQAKVSTEQIAELLQSVVASTRHMAGAMESAAEEVQEGTQIVQVAGETFQKVWNSIQEVSDQIQEVSAASEEMSAGSEQVAAVLDNLAEIAKNASESSQSVAASSEEQLAIVEEIADSAAVMSGKMKELDQEMKKFII